MQQACWHVYRESISVYGILTLSVPHRFTRSLLFDVFYYGCEAKRSHAHGRPFRQSYRHARTGVCVEYLHCVCAYTCVRRTWMSASLVRESSRWVRHGLLWVRHRLLGGLEVSSASDSYWCQFARRCIIGFDVCGIFRRFAHGLRGQCTNLFINVWVVLVHTGSIISCSWAVFVEFLRNEILSYLKIVHKTVRTIPASKHLIITNAGHGHGAEDMAEVCVCVCVCVVGGS